MDHKAIIQSYKSLKPGCCCAKQEEYCAGARNIAEAIEKAAMARDANGRKNPHQYRVPEDKLELLKQKLLTKKTRIEQARDFDELLQIIVETGVFKGEAVLTCYDTALRLGFYTHKLPQKIYLHAGTRTGAEKLLKRKINARFLLKRNLPEPFKSCDLKEHELEDLLCIYKNDL
jgi:hypothetical protein